MRALLSVYDKDGIVDLASGLVDLGYEIVSTGGTLRTIAGAGIPVQSVSEVTGFPEILDGRVKTLHPAIHAGILARRDDPAHMRTLTDHQIEAIDLVAVNLYPFAATIARPNVSLSEAVEQIDIGGPAMLRAAAKSFADVVILTDPTDYQPTLAALTDGPLGPARRRALAAKAFAHVAAYDAVVATYLAADDESTSLPPRLSIVGEKVADLRYGENPHQRGATYRRVDGEPATGLLDAVQLAGKALSFNNLLDADAAWQTIRSFAAPTVAIIKHTIPCGLASRESLEAAFAAAFEGDPLSAFGGIVALNRPVDAATGERIAEHFFEVVIAPDFTSEAIESLGRRKQLRLLKLALDTDRGESNIDIRPIRGGLLVQDLDAAGDDPDQWRVVSRRQPTDAERHDLAFAWNAARYVKSNAIVFAAERMLVGVGSGQPNRVESVAIAARKAGARAAGAVMASDAFFPFADGIEAAAAAGVRAVVQPGGSVRDDEVIAAVDRAEMAMLFTSVRHFRH